MSNAKIVLITGPSGSGKTTTAKKFIKQQNDTWAHINQDSIRRLVKSGYASADGLRKDWTPETKNQWKASIPICVDMAKQYIEHGINCLLEIYSTEKEFHTWEQLLGNSNYILVKLFTDEKTALERNANRDNNSKLTTDKIIECFEDIQSLINSKNGIKIDNTSHSSEEVANKIKELL